MLFSVFFFKQKTAYEMRISDWSSDVCSSDLHVAREPGPILGAGDHGCQRGHHLAAIAHAQGKRIGTRKIGRELVRQAGIEPNRTRPAFARTQYIAVAEPAHGDQTLPRSEENTSELQSLMRNSYSVFRLKKKKDTSKSNHTTANI